MAAAPGLDFVVVIHSAPHDIRDLFRSVWVDYCGWNHGEIQIVDRRKMKRAAKRDSAGIVVYCGEEAVVTGDALGVPHVEQAGESQVKRDEGEEEEKVDEVSRVKEGDG